MSHLLLDRFRGCLVGGAIGDALGARVEFWTLDAIRTVYGLDGPYRLDEGFTDDTQMTLFTAEGLVRARAAKASGEALPEHLWAAYRRWGATQGVPVLPAECTGGLLAVPGLHVRRAPGLTCLAALQQAAMPRSGVADNASKGCGGVMRAAPCALAGHPAVGLPGTPYEVGVSAAALTHGHPTGAVAAGALAHLVRALLDGQPLGAAARATHAAVRLRDATGETTRALGSALALVEAGAPFVPETFARLGGAFAQGSGAWVAEEALAGAVWAALDAQDGTPEAVRRALRLAVTHGGDSDSTGAIAGNLLGAAYGLDALPADWRAALPLVDLVEAMADALVGADAVAQAAASGQRAGTGAVRTTKSPRPAWAAPSHAAAG